MGGIILQSDFDSVRDLVAAEIDLTSAADSTDADTSEENSQIEQLFMIDKRPVNLQQDIYRTTSTTSDDGDSLHERDDDDDADDLLQATNYLDLDPEVEDDVECLDDDPSINTLPSDLNSSDNTTDVSQTTTESVSQSTVETTTESTSESTTQSTVESTADSTSEVASITEEETGSVVESLVSMVTTESAESLQQSESTMEQTSSSDDFKDCVV